MSDDTPTSDDGPGIMETAVTAAVDGLALEPQDLAMSALVRSYARAIDRAGHGADVLSDLGPKMFAALESLGLSPRARAAMTKRGSAGGSTRPDRSRLDELRERRARKHDATPLDPAAP